MSDALNRAPHKEGDAPSDGGNFDPRKVYETLAGILNRRQGIEVRLVGVTYTPPGDREE